MRKQTLSTVFTTSRQIGKRINTFFFSGSPWTFKWIIDWKAGKWSIAWEKCNSQSSPEPKPLPQMMHGRRTVHNLLVQKSWTAARCHGAAGGWVGEGGGGHFVVTKLQPLKRKLSPATLKYVWESRASQVALAQFFFFCVPWRIFMFHIHDGRSRKRGWKEP